MENNKRYFQFLFGERKNEVVQFDKIEQEDDLIFVSFKDGSRCNEQLILPLNETHVSNQLMAEVDSPNNLWSFREEWVGRQEEITAPNADGEVVIVQPFLEGKRKITPVPPRRTTSNFGYINSYHQTQQVQPIIEVKPIIQDPISILMENAKKIPTDIEMNINISLPSKSLYNIAEESFENGGIKVIDYIVNNLDDKQIREKLRDALLIAYTYKETTCA